MKPHLAQILNISSRPGPTIGIKGPLGPGLDSLGAVVSTIVYKLLFPLGAAILLIMLIWGGYGFLMSQGNPEKVKAGRARITSALIGFVLLVIAYLMIRVISYILGIGKGLF